MKLSYSQRIVAGIAASGSGRIDAARLVRKVLWSLVRAFLLAAASQQVDTWLSVALIVLAGLQIAPIFFIGLAQRGSDERLARLSLLSEHDRGVLTNKNRLYGRTSS